jgi:hypothetical protein
MSISCKIDKMWEVLGNYNFNGNLVNTIKNSSNKAMNGGYM